MKKINFRWLARIIIISILISITFFVFKDNLMDYISSQKSYEKSELVMDTFVTLTAYGANAQEAVEKGFAKIDEIDRLASTSNTDSDIYKINEAAGKQYVEVHPEILKMIQTAIQYSKLSNGAFDISVGPLISLWGIGTDNEKVPSEEEIQSALSLVGYQNIAVDESKSSIMLLEEGMSIDLGAVAKGYAADEVRKIFEEYNIKNALINLGSSTIDAMGKNEKNKNWGIGIMNPRSEDTSQYLTIIRTSNEVLSTSGDYERYFIKDGKRYHHILDPKTGYPADNQVMSVTVVIDNTVAENGMLSDMISTIIFVLGSKEGIQFVDNLEGVSCEITKTDYTINTSSGFQQRMEGLNKDFSYEE